MSRDVVILDIDGTLVDSNYLHALAWARAFEDEGHRVAVWRIHRGIGMGGDKFVTALLGEQVEKDDGDALRKGWQRHYKKLLDEAYPLAGAADLVRGLHERGFIVAVASSGEKKFVDDALKQLDIGDAVSVVTSHADAENSKPEPDILTATLRQARADRAVMVGDSVFDVEAAARIGLGCITVRSGGFGAAELQEAGALVVLDDLTTALDLDWGAYLRPPRIDPEDG